MVIGDDCPPADDDSCTAGLVDVCGLPTRVADAIRLLVAAAADLAATPASASTDAAGRTAQRVCREYLGDVIQAAEAVKAFSDASLVDATAALVEDVAVDHGVRPYDRRYAAKVAAYRKQACPAVVHEVQLLTGCTLTAARERVRFATAMPERVGGAHELLRAGGCSWERARIAYAETAHLDPVLAGAVIGRLLAPPERTTAADGGAASVPLSHSGFRTRVRRQLALTESAAEGRERRHEDALSARDACTFPGRDGTAAFQVTGDATKVFASQQRVAELAKAARAAGDPRTVAQLRADIALDLLIRGTVAGDDRLGDAPAGRLQVIVPLAAILPEGAIARVTGRSAGATGAAEAGAGGAFGLGEVPGLGFLTPAQVRDVAVRAGSTWARLVTDPVTGAVIDAASTYRVPAGMARLVQGRDHTCRAPGDCGVPAAQTDLDHDTEYRSGATEPHEGATHPDNPHAAHRAHHNVKTSRFWSSQQHDDASISWRTLTRRLRTTAFDHHRPGDHAPPRLSWIEQQFGIRLALCREHDVIPHVFTDLDDLHLLTDKPAAGDDNGRIRYFPPGIYLDRPEPPPPF